MAILNINKHDWVQIHPADVRRVYVGVQLTATGDVEYFVCVDAGDEEFSSDTYASYELARAAAEEFINVLTGVKL